jgi:hypothetical protein
MLEQLEKEANDIKKSALRLSWYMRGGATYEDVMNMSSSDRQLINEMVEENLETTKNSKLPFF